MPLNVIMYHFKPIFHCDAKPFALGPGFGLDPQHHNFALPIPTCWYLEMLKFALPSTQMLKFALPQTPTPNASQWNIGCVGSPTQNFSVGHVHSFFLGVAWQGISLPYKSLWFKSHRGLAVKFPFSLSVFC